MKITGQRCKYTTLDVEIVDGKQALVKSRLHPDQVLTLQLDLQPILTFLRTQKLTRAKTLNELKPKDIAKYVRA